jgi:NFU1 iron-sulfur cluster scaffold homolog, mitochondrial
MEQVVQDIRELLEERVKPFVQQDGGNVEFVKIDEEGVCWLELQGACSGCPKSQITLNIQIKQMLLHYFPDHVKDVREFEPPDEIPRPGGTLNPDGSVTHE